MDGVVKGYLHDDLRSVRDAVVWKVEGLSEYDARRPLTVSGTNLLGIVKHLALWEARYLGEVMGRPFPDALPPWDDHAANRAHFWATADESRAEIVDRYRRTNRHADETIDALPLDAPGHVPWWPRPDVTLFAILVHLLTETERHAGHADILREQLDGSVGRSPRFASVVTPDDPAAAAFRDQVEAAARAAAGEH